MRLSWLSIAVAFKYGLPFDTQHERLELPRGLLPSRSPNYTQCLIYWLMQPLINFDKSPLVRLHQGEREKCHLRIACCSKLLRHRNILRVHDFRFDLLP